MPSLVALADAGSYRQAENCGQMKKSDKFVTALVGSGVGEITSAAGKLWHDVLQTPKTLFTCVAIAMAVLGGAVVMLTEFFCDCRLL